MKDIPRSIVELKGFGDGLHLFIDPDANIEDLIPRIEKRMEKLGDSLAGTGVSINFGGGSLGAQELIRLERLLHDTYGLEIKQLIRLERLLHDTYGLEIKQLIGKSDRMPWPQDGSQIAGAPALHQAEHQNGGYNLHGEVEKTQLIRQTLRSGQVERYLEGNVVILGDVNPGAEVIAARDIIVLGTLRGVAHAGALGDISSVIIAMSLVPTQLRIARFISRPPSNQQPQGDKVEFARIRDNDAVVVEEFTDFNHLAQVGQRSSVAFSDSRLE
jgi:septum site-determining protein MinC